MSRTILFLAGLPALAAAITGSGTSTSSSTTCQPGPTTEYIQNGDFTDRTNGWSVQYGSNYDTYYGAGPGGSYIYILALNGDNLDDNIVSQEVSGLTPGYTYTFGMWWELLAAGTGSCTVTASLNSIDLGSETVTSADSGVWTQFSATYDASGESSELAIMLSCTAGSFSLDSEVNFAEITLEGPAQVCSTTSAIGAASSSSAVQIASSSTSIDSSSAISTTSSSSAVRIASSSISTGSSSAVSTSSSSSAVHIATPSSSTIHDISSTHPPPSSAARPTSSSTAVRIICSRSSIVHDTSATSPVGATSRSSIAMSSTGAASITSQASTSSVSSAPSTTQPATIPFQVTTSTILSTEVHTITSCAASVIDCPARDRTTLLLTETIVLGTTICPVTATETGSVASSTGISVATEGGSLSNGLSTTQIYTVTATSTGVMPTAYSFTTVAPLIDATSSISTEGAGGFSNSSRGVSSAAGATLISSSLLGTSTGTAVEGAASSFTSSAYTLSTPTSTLHASSSVDIGTATTKAAGPTYTGGSLSLKADIMPVLLTLITILIL